MRGAGADSGANEDRQKVVSQRNKRLHFGCFRVVLLGNPEREHTGEHFRLPAYFWLF